MSTQKLKVASSATRRWRWLGALAGFLDRKSVV